MTETEPTTKARKTPEYQPWKILCSEVTKIPAEHDAAVQAEYDSLAKCEAACRKLAIANVGLGFTPVKYGKTVRATEKVVVKLQ